RHPAAASEAPDSASPYPASWHGSSEATCTSRAHSVREAPSPFGCRARSERERVAITERVVVGTITLCLTTTRRSTDLLPSGPPTFENRPADPSDPADLLT